MTQNTIIVRVLKLIVLPLIGGVGFGCSHSLHLSHVDDIHPAVNKVNSSRVRADGKQFVFMGFTTQTDYVDEAYADLQRQCPKGILTGITTRYSTSHGFFSWTNRVRMSGRCISQR